MKVGITTYPTALQNQAGLKVHIEQTMSALQGLGVAAQIVDPYHCHLSEFDLIHHFSLNHTSFRILQVAKSFGVPCVLTPMVEPVQSIWRLRKIRWVETIMHAVFGNEFRNRWRDTLDGLEIADAITPITETERQVIEYLSPDTKERISVIPNGVTNDFFSASPGRFYEICDIKEPFVLLPSSIQPYKNQLPVIHAARSLGFRTVMVGPVADEGYLQDCLIAGGDYVTYLGVFDYPSPELTATFAAAGIVVLASKVEPFGLVPFEALAAGTPAVLTSVSGLKKEAVPPYFQRVDPDNADEIAHVIQIGMSTPRNRDACRVLVNEMRWSHVARRLLDVYEQVLADAV